MTVLLAWRDGWAQTPSTPAVQLGGFTAEGYHQEDHTRLKFRISGAKGVPEGGGVRITQLLLETFRLTGEREMVITAPDCVYDPSKREASSPGQLHLQTGDGRYSVEGHGFLIQLDRESTLTISNQVRSVIHRVTNAPPGEAKPPLVITSKRFEFDMATYRGVYREQVHGDDPEMEFSCDVLTATASTNNQSFEVLTAETDVSLLNKKNGLRANSDRAVYTRADERMVLSGNAAWKQDRQEGRADRATIDRREQSLEATGNVAMKVPRETLSAGGFFLASTTAASVIPVDDSPLVDLLAQEFEYFPARSNLTVAEGAVRIVDSTNQLTCDKLSVQETAPAQQTAIAEGHVVVAHGNQGQGIHSERAIYTKADDTIVFTGEPEWKMEQSDGRAERLTIHNSTREVHAEGNVATRVAVGAQQGALLNFFPDAGDTNQPPRVIEVSAKELRAKDRRVSFVGDAHAHQSPLTGSEPRMRADTFEVGFRANTNTVESIRAMENVIYEQGKPGITNGPDRHARMTARRLTARTDPATGALSSLLAEDNVQIEQPGVVGNGERAAYNAATDVLELTGNPTLKTPELSFSKAQKLSWHRAKNRYYATGPYTMIVPEAAKRVSESSKSP